MSFIRSLLASRARPTPGTILVVALLLAFTAVRFLGQGSLTLAAMNLVSQWFVRWRGLALSITTLGFALGKHEATPHGVDLDDL